MARDPFRGWKLALWIYAATFFFVLYAPLVMIAVLSFNDSEITGFPVTEFSLRWRPGEELFDKLLTQIATGNPPDAAYVSDWMTGAFAQEGGLTPLDEYVAKSNLIDLSDYVPAFLGTSQVEGVQYGLPFTSETTGLFYRTDRFEEAGLDPNNPPKTWDEFQQAAEKWVTASVILPHEADPEAYAAEIGVPYEQWMRRLSRMEVNNGALVALELLRLDGQGVETLVLDSPAVPWSSWVAEERFANLRSVFQRLFEDCRTVPACAAAYPDLERRFGSLHEALVAAGGEEAEVLAAATASQHCCVVALGGYGRRELAPCSDIDLMVLYPGGGPGAKGVPAAAEALFYELWDSGMQVGHSVRTLKEALGIARTDINAETAFLDARLLGGCRHKEPGENRQDDRPRCQH